jgi:ABC-type oligopeptide transport system substrate-binding subunit
MLAGCGSGSTSTSTSSSGSTGGSSVEAESGSYTYRITYSGVSTFNPTDQTGQTEFTLNEYTRSGLYGFWLNDAKDGYDVVCELASEFPVDLTSEYAGNETYGVPADATEGYAWQIKIRDDATWEDGTPITVDDFEYTFQQYLNPEMKNYRASTLYDGNWGLANAVDYYNNDQAGEAKMSLAVDKGLAMSDLSAGSDGQYVDPDGNKAYFGWSVDNLNIGYVLTDYADYMEEDTYNALDALANDNGYIPMTEESVALMYSFTGSDAWGNESEDDLINYAYYEDGIAEETPWENVGFIKNDDYTFTIVLKNPTSLFYVEYSSLDYTLLKEDLYEANKQESGGLIKSSYGTAVDKYASYGPYKIVSYQEGKEIKLTKNENWYGYTDGNHEGQYQTTDMVWTQIDEHTTQVSMFLQGNLDYVGLTSDDMENYGTSDYVYYTPTTYTYYLAVNTDYDTLKSREVDGVNKTILTYLDFRKAMSYALDRSDYVKSCTAGADPGYGLLNDVYICDPDSGLAYRDTDAAQNVLKDVYEVDDINDLTGYNKEEATQLLQSAYEACLADGNISDSDIVEIDYHVYGSDSYYQKMVDYVQDAILEAAKGTALEDRIQINLVEDQDYWDNMSSGQCDLSLTAWGAGEMDPYNMMVCYTDPTYIKEYGFDPYQDLTINVEGEDITMSFNSWYTELFSGTYAVASLDVRNTILAGIEEGVLLNYHAIPVYSSTTAGLYSQRIILGSEEYVNPVVIRGGIQFMTYTMDDAEWADYCAEQGNSLSY